MLQFVALLNELSTPGAEEFGRFFNTATSSDAARAGNWLNSASSSQIKEAAAFLNRNDLDGFRNHIGLGGGFWSRLFGKRKKAKPFPTTSIAPQTMSEPVPMEKLVKPTAILEKPAVNCPHCDHRLRYGSDSAGKKAKCPKCGHLFRLPGSTGDARAAVAPAEQANENADWQSLITYLKNGGPAEISTVKEVAAIPVINTYHAAVVADHSCPKLTYYLLKGKTRATGSFPSFPYLVVAAGEQSEHDKAWHFGYDSILERSLPGKSWSDFTWEGGYANHSKPGCQLSSTASFDQLANAISQGGYQLDKVLRPIEQKITAAEPAKDHRQVKESDKAESHDAKIRRLADQNVHLLRELMQLVASDGGFGNASRIRAIGEELNGIGGMDLMQCGYYGVRNGGHYFSQDIWDGIGSWRS